MLLNQLWIKYGSWFEQVVQNGIGYSAAEVTAALSSPDKENVAKMKAAMKRFQAFLAKFEVILKLEALINCQLWTWFGKD